VIVTKPIYDVVKQSDGWRVVGPSIHFLDLRSSGYESEGRAKEMAQLFSLLWMDGFKRGQKDLRRNLCGMLGIVPDVESDDPS
jgi:hypothetical protein